MLVLYISHWSDCRALTHQSHVQEKQPGSTDALNGPGLDEYIV